MTAKVIMTSTLPIRDSFAKRSPFATPLSQLAAVLRVVADIAHAFVTRLNDWLEIPSSNRPPALRLVRLVSRSTYRIEEMDVNTLPKTLASIAAGALLATSALAQIVASLVVSIENVPAPRYSWSLGQMELVHDT